MSFTKEKRKKITREKSEFHIKVIHTHTHTPYIATTQLKVVYTYIDIQIYIMRMKERDEVNYINTEKNKPYTKKP